MSPRQARPTDLDVIGATLGDAFADDPMFRFMLRRDDIPPSRLAPLFTSSARHVLAHDDDLVFIDDDGAAAVWRPVDGWRIGPAEQLRSTPAVLRTFGRNLVRALGVLSKMEKTHPTAPHYYLEFIGPRRDAQGRGLGSAMLAPMLERCDREGLPAYLESSNLRNVPFYARHGFVERDLINSGAGAPVMTTMWRDPR